MEVEGEGERTAVRGVRLARGAAQRCSGGVKALRRCVLRAAVAAAAAALRRELRAVGVCGVVAVEHIGLLVREPFDVGVGVVEAEPVAERRPGPVVLKRDVPEAGAALVAPALVAVAPDDHGRVVACEEVRATAGKHERVGQLARRCGLAAASRACVTIKEAAPRSARAS